MVLIFTREKFLPEDHFKPLQRILIYMEEAGRDCEDLHDPVNVFFEKKKLFTWPLKVKRNTLHDPAVKIFKLFIHSLKFLFTLFLMIMSYSSVTKTTRSKINLYDHIAIVNIQKRVCFPFLL